MIIAARLQHYITKSLPKNVSDFSKLGGAPSSWLSFLEVPYLGEAGLFINTRNVEKN